VTVFTTRTRGTTGIQSVTMVIRKLLSTGRINALSPKTHAHWTSATIDSQPDHADILSESAALSWKVRPGLGRTTLYRGNTRDHGAARRGMFSTDTQYVLCNAADL